MQNRIRELRKQNSITMRQLGQHLGLAESTISQYETGKREPDLKTLLKISEYFGVSVDYLLGEDTNSIASRIIQARWEKNLSRKQLADETGIPLSTIAQYEKGAKIPNSQHLQIIADVLGVKCTDLVDSREDLVHAGNVGTGEDNAADKETPFHVGDSFFNGNVVVDSIEEQDSGRVMVTFQVDDTGMKPDELIFLFNTIDALSKQSGMSIGGLAQLAEAAAKAAKEIANSNPTKEKPPQD